MNNLVSAKWLKDNINDKNIVIVDCRFNLMDKEYGKKSYEKGHIKGAKRVDIETELSSIVKKHGGRHPLPSVKELKNTFENIGISNDSVVISYDEGDLAGASRLWWILKYLGHEKAYVLDGGLEAFKELGWEISTENEKSNKGKLDISIQEHMKVDMEYVKDRINIRGGTKFSPVFEYANNRKINLLVYFTDGEGESRLSVVPRGYKVLWVISGRGDKLSLNNPYGAVKKLSKVEVKEDTIDMSDVRDDGYSMNNQEPIF